MLAWLNASPVLPLSVAEYGDSELPDIWKQNREKRERLACRPGAPQECRFLAVAGPGFRRNPIFRRPSTRVRFGAPQLEMRLSRFLGVRLDP